MKRTSIRLGGIVYVVRHIAVWIFVSTIWTLFFVPQASGLWLKVTIDGNLDGATGLYVADMDGDTDLDIVATGIFAKDVVWYEAPSWTKHVIDGNLDGALGIYVADMDGDTDLDVVATGRYANDVLWYEAPSWSKHVIDGNLEDPWSVYIADMNDDDTLDVVATGLGAWDVVWYEASSWTKYVIDGNLTYANGLYVSDMDGDTDLDVVATGPGTGDVVWYEAPGWTKHVIDENLDDAWCVYAADMDGDTDLDVVATGSSADDVVWYEAPTWIKHLIDGNLDGAWRVYVVDMDDDSDMDVVATGYNANDVVWYQRTPPCTLTITASDGGTTNPVPGIYVYPCGSSVEVTAIPDPGYVFGHWEVDGMAVVEWTDKNDWDAPDAGWIVWPALADLDNDGDYDLLIGEHYGWSYGYENTGTPLSPVWTDRNAWDVKIPYDACPAFADLDNDGDYDLLIGSMWGQNHAYENTGSVSNPIWTNKDSWDAPDIGTQSSPAFADLDNDADYDLLIGEGQGVSHAYENTGNPSSPVWTDKNDWNAPDIGDYMPRPAFADLDNDGDYDLLIGSQMGKSHAYENSGSPDSPVWIDKNDWDTPDIGTQGFPAFADLDDDGDYDVLIGEREGVSHAYENTGQFWVYSNPINVIMDTNHALLAVFSVHDVAIINAAPYDSVIGQGGSAFIDITVENQGDFTETFDVSAYYDTTLIQTKTATSLPPSQDIIITFTWNTTGVAPDSYTISAYAYPVPDEADTTDNRCTDGIVRIVACGDCNANENVDIADAVYLVRYLFKNGPDPVPSACIGGVNTDGEVTIADVVYLVNYVLKNGPPPVDDCCAS